MWQAGPVSLLLHPTIGSCRIRRNPPPPLTFRKAVTECKRVWSISVAACLLVEKSDAGINRTVLVFPLIFFLKKALENGEEATDLDIAGPFRESPGIGIDAVGGAAAEIPGKN